MIFCISKKILTVVIIAVFGMLFSVLSTLQAQDLLQKYDGMDFVISGQSSSAPFNGGMDNARYQFVDIDGDGLLDLFTYDRDTTLYYYKNTGTLQNARFKLITQNYNNFIINDWFQFVDIDNDNDLDMFAGAEMQKIKFYKNNGSVTNPSFSLQISELKTNSDTTIYSDVGVVPAFKDIDGDGDKDFFTGVSIGSIKFYENIGSPTVFSFKYITDEWEDILIISPADFYEPGTVPFVKKESGYSPDGNRHGANSLEFADVDNDNDYDLLFGDFFSKGIYYIINNGSATNPDMEVIDSSYPGNQPYISDGYNSVRLVDIDDDNDLDMFISSLYASQADDNFVLYKNNGSATTPLFQKESDNYLRNVDVGNNSNLTFADVNNDGLTDLFIGSSDARVIYYKNTGSQIAPKFNLESDSLSIQSSGFYYAPVLVDIDNDNDKDLFVGSFLVGQMKFYRNTGSPENFNFTFESNAADIGIDSLGQSNNPVLVDIDNDNDYDLFSGDWNGRIHYYENTGNVSSFNFQFRSKFYSGIDIGDESVPEFYDLDNDGDYDLFIGKRDGRITYYKNEGNASSPNFVFQTDNYKNINVYYNSAPAFIDIDNDTDPDLFLGNVKGGLYYFENRDVVGISTISQNIPDNFSLKQNYPNPYNPSTNISFDIRQASFVELKIFDVTGKEITKLVSENLTAGSYNYNFDARNLPSGAYFYSLITDNFTSTKKMILLK